MRRTWQPADMPHFSPLSSSRFARGFETRRRNFVYFWHTHEKGGYIVISVLATILLAFGLIVHFSIAGHDYSRDVHERTQDLNCLTKNIYHEARGEPVDGQYAVAEVTMNRVASKHYPNTVCDVVYQVLMDRARCDRPDQSEDMESRVEDRGRGLRRAGRAAGRWRALLSLEVHSPPLVPGKAPHREDRPAHLLLTPSQLSSFFSGDFIKSSFVTHMYLAR
jgi:hypothetical protein